MSEASFGIGVCSGWGEGEPASAGRRLANYAAGAYIRTRYRGGQRDRRPRCVDGSTTARSEKMPRMSGLGGTVAALLLATAATTTLSAQSAHADSVLAGIG